MVLLAVLLAVLLVALPVIPLDTLPVALCAGPFAPRPKAADLMHAYFLEPGGFAIDPAKSPAYFPRNSGGPLPVFPHMVPPSQAPPV